MTNVTTRIEPAGHRILVLPDEVEKKSAGGIILPEIARDRKQAENIFGEIVKVGPTCWKNLDTGEPWAKEGDKIAYAKHAGIMIKDSDTGTWYQIINDEDVVCIVKNA